MKNNTGIENTGDWNSGYMNSGDWNSGYMNSGYMNSGYMNSGYMNSGNRNSGNWNSGDWNSGNWNSGDWNSGDRNSGNRNSGNWNSGDWNSGNWNSGDWNSGYMNSGNMNSGNRNSGNRNSGNWNSGDWNSGDRNSGYLNTNEPKVRIFNKETDISREDIIYPDFFYFGLNEWVSENKMTDKEKDAYPSYATTGGYLKTREYKQAWRESWDKANDEDRRKVMELPNWDNEIFKEISGIDVEKELNQNETITIGGIKYLKKEVEEKLKDIKAVA